MHVIVLVTFFSNTETFVHFIVYSFSVYMTEINLFFEPWGFYVITIFNAFKRLSIVGIFKKEYLNILKKIYIANCPADTANRCHPVVKILSIYSIEMAFKQQCYILYYFISTVYHI